MTLKIGKCEYRKGLLMILYANRIVKIHYVIMNIATARCMAIVIVGLETRQSCIYSPAHTTILQQPELRNIMKYDHKCFTHTLSLTFKQNIWVTAMHNLCTTKYLLHGTFVPACWHKLFYVPHSGNLQGTSCIYQCAIYP